MISIVRRLIVAVLFVAFAMPVMAASRYTIVTELIAEGRRPRSEVANITLAGDKGRIDFIERNGHKEKKGLYLMTWDGGKTAILGNRGKSICSEWDSEEFFREMGMLLHKARRWTNPEITDAKVEKITVTSIEELDPSKIPVELFDMPKCKKASQKKMGAAAKDMFEKNLK